MNRNRLNEIIAHNNWIIYSRQLNTHFLNNLELHANESRTKMNEDVCSHRVYLIRSTKDYYYTQTNQNTSHLMD